MNRHTSEALLCMSCRCQDQCLHSTYFQLMICHNLCLPIYTSSRTHCSCGQPLDVWGDHFFNCQRYHPKTIIHNSLRDTLHLIYAFTGKHTGFILSKSDVHLEPLNLAHCYPTSRPGDLQLDLVPTYVSSPLLPFAKAAVDVCVTNSFSSQSVGDSSYTVPITKHLQKAEQAKFCGPSVSTTSTFVNGEMVIRALNESNTLLILFIVDPFGGLGPIANRFLFGLRPDPAPDPLDFHSATSQEAYNNTMSPAAPTSLSHCADQYWSRNSPHLPFGNTYHSWFPTNWIRQTRPWCQHQSDIRTTFVPQHPQKLYSPITTNTAQPIPKHNWTLHYDTPGRLL